MTDALGPRGKFGVLATRLKRKLEKAAQVGVAMGSDACRAALRDYGIKDRIPGRGSLLSDH